MLNILILLQEVTNHLSLWPIYNYKEIWWNQIKFRRLFENNHQLSLRFYASSFFYTIKPIQIILALPSAYVTYLITIITV
jgi:hypothetical protein